MEHILKYFNAEKSESLLFILLGMLAIVIAIYSLIKVKLSFYNGMAISLVLVAIIQLTVGLSVYFRSPKDIDRLEKYLSVEKAKIATEEIPRMKNVMKNFVIYRYAEIVLIATGLILMFAFKEKDFVKGLGLGLFIQAGIMLTLDFFAEKRGFEYLSYLINLIKTS